MSYVKRQTSNVKHRMSRHTSHLLQLLAHALLLAKRLCKGDADGVMLPVCVSCVTCVEWPGIDACLNSCMSFVFTPPPLSEKVRISSCGFHLRKLCDCVEAHLRIASLFIALKLRPGGSLLLGVCICHDVSMSLALSPERFDATP